MADVYRKSALEKISSSEQIDKAITVTSPLSWLALAAVTLIVIAATVWAFSGTIPVTVTAPGTVTDMFGTNSVYAPEAGRIIEIMVRENQPVRKDDIVATYRVGDDGELKAIRAPAAGTVTRIMAGAGREVDRGEDILRFSPFFSDEPHSTAVVCYVRQNDALELRPDMEARVSLYSLGGRTYGQMPARIVYIDDHPATDAGMRQLLGSDNGMISAYREGSSTVVAVTCELLKDPGAAGGYIWSDRRGANKNMEFYNANVRVRFIVEEVRPVDMLFSGMTSRREGN